MQVEGPDQVTRAHASSDPGQNAYERLMGMAESAAAQAQMSQKNGQEERARQRGTRGNPGQAQQQQQQHQQHTSGEHARPAGQLAEEDTLHGSKKVG